MRKFLLLGLAALTLAACGTQPATAGTGLRGTVTIGPTCPRAADDRDSRPQPSAGRSPRPQAGAKKHRDFPCEPAWLLLSGDANHLDPGLKRRSRLVGADPHARVCQSSGRPDPIDRPG